MTRIAHPVPQPQVRVAEQKALYGSAPRPFAGPPAGYYDIASGKQGQALLDALHGIAKRDHHPLGYDQARNGLFALVDDVDGNDSVPDIYTGIEVPGVHDKDTAYAKHMNTEHTWPQSLGATGAAKSDLNQLMASDADTNNRRASNPYGLVSKTTWTSPQGPTAADISRLGTDANGHTVFEPRASQRGNIARALLYFSMRYSSDRPRGYSANNFRYELPTLLKWNSEDPPDQTELLRNDAVQSLQGNRNPFVDHPEWVNQIGSAWDLTLSPRARARAAARAH
jgi:endonuclease I